MVTATNTTSKLPFRTNRPGEQRGGIGICIYGPSNAGKTTLVGTMGGKGLFIDIPTAEGGTIVLRTAAIEARVTFTEVLSWEDLDPIYDFLYQDHAQTFQWVAFDSITGLTDIARRKIKRDSLGRMKTVGRVTQGDWGDIGQEIAELIYKFQALPVMKIYVAQERVYDLDKLNGEVMNSIIGPSTTPFAHAALRPVVSLMGRIYEYPLGKGRSERRLLIGGSSQYEVKHREIPERVGQIGNIVREPNLTQLIRFIYGRDDTPPDFVDEAAEEATDGMVPV